MSLTRITPADSQLGLPSLKDSVSKLIKKDNVPTLRLDLVSDSGINFSNHKILASDFGAINFFQLDESSRIQLRIKFLEPMVTSRFFSTYLLSFITLGIFPSLDQTSLKVRFDLFDKKERIILKSFSYDLRKREYRGWASPAIAAFVATGSTLGVYQDVDTTGRNTPILEPMARKVSEDVKIELDDEKLLRALSSKEKFALTPAMVILGEETNSMKIKEGIENRLVKFGIPIVSKNAETMNAILEILANEQKGLYASGAKAGQLEGVRTIFKISIKKENDQTDIFVEMIDVEKGTTQANMKYNLKSKSEYSLEIFFDDLALEMASAKKMKNY